MLASQISERGQQTSVAFSSPSADRCVAQAELMLNCREPIEEAFWTGCGRMPARALVFATCVLYRRQRDYGRITGIKPTQSTVVPPVMLLFRLVLVPASPRRTAGAAKAHGDRSG